MKNGSKIILLLISCFVLPQNKTLCNQNSNQGGVSFFQNQPTGGEIQGSEVANMVNANKPQSQSYTSGNEQNGLPKVAVGFPNALQTLTMFFSPSCGHCSHFFGTDYQKLYKKFIATGKIQFKPRLIINFANGNVDDVLGRLMWARGPQQFVPIMLFFMSAQRAWFFPAQERDPKIRAAKLGELMKHIPKNSVAIKDVINAVEINTNSPQAEDFIKVLGLIYGLSHTEIDMALKDERTGNSLLLTADDPLVRQIKAVPAFFVDKKRMPDDFKPVEYFESEQKRNPTTVTVPANSQRQR